MSNFRKIVLAFHVLMLLAVLLNTFVADNPLAALYSTFTAFAVWAVGGAVLFAADHFGLAS